jgi:hypothetical protein
MLVVSPKMGRNLEGSRPVSSYRYHLYLAILVWADPIHFIEVPVQLQFGGQVYVPGTPISSAVCQSNAPQMYVLRVLILY